VRIGPFVIYRWDAMDAAIKASYASGQVAGAHEVVQRIKHQMPPQSIVQSMYSVDLNLIAASVAADAKAAAKS